MNKLFHFFGPSVQWNILKFGFGAIVIAEVFRIAAMTGDELENPERKIAMLQASVPESIFTQNEKARRSLSYRIWNRIRHPSSEID
jgi:hypothetical protein